MNQPAICSECGGTRVLVQVTITTPLTELDPTKERELQLQQPKRSIGFFGLSGKSNTSSLFARTCTRCGNTTLYATDPQDLIPD